jgi:3-oxoacyl-[acyl-carrier protein] reductase
MDLGLRDRAFIVTGASGGIGSATALALAAEGAALLLVGRNAETLAPLAARASEAGSPRAQTIVVDINEPAAAAAVIDACLAAHGRLDGLVNNAGTTTVRPWDELSDAEWEAQWSLNVMAPMRLMRAAAPEMVRRGWGRIVNVSSSSGKRPSSLNMAYGVTKAGMLSLSRSFADALAGEGVLVNAVTPGPIGGDAWLSDGGLADQRAQAAGQDRETLLAGLAKGLPIARLGTNEEIADVIVFLCSERASNVVGAAWSVDGGSVSVII